VKGVEEKLEAGDEWQKIAYAAALVSRMYPNYALFSELTETGDKTVFENILNLVWEFASGENQQIDFCKQQDKLEPITPDPEQFDMYGVWPALDAVVALASLLSVCDRFDREEISNISIVSRATIISFLEATGEGADDPEQALLLADAQYSEDVLQRLQKDVASNGRRQAVKSLRLWVAGFEDSNIGLVN